MTHSGSSDYSHGALNKNYSIRLSYLISVLLRCLFLFSLGRGVTTLFCFLFFAVNGRCTRVVFGREGDGYRWPFSGYSLWLVVVSRRRSDRCSVVSASDVTVYGSVAVSECSRRTTGPLSGAATPRIGAATRKNTPRTHPGSTWWIAHSLGNVSVQYSFISAIIFVSLLILYFTVVFYFTVTITWTGTVSKLY